MSGKAFELMKDAFGPSEILNNVISFDDDSITVRALADDERRDDAAEIERITKESQRWFWKLDEAQKEIERLRARIKELENPMPRIEEPFRLVDDVEEVPDGGS